MIIAIDAMGGDHAPKATVEGAIQAAKDWPELRIVLVGDREKIEPFLINNPGNIEIRHASEVIATDEEPVKAVRRKKDSSLVVAVNMVKNKEVDAVISAGNTGALMAAGLFIVRRIDGIDRPALSTTLPTLDDAGFDMLDLGANADAKPENLYA